MEGARHQSLDEREVAKVRVHLKLVEMERDILKNVDQPDSEKSEKGGDNTSRGYTYFVYFASG